MRTWWLLVRSRLPVLRDLPDPGDRPLPRVGVEAGRSVPGWALHAALAPAAAALVAVPATRSAMSPTVVVLGALVAAAWLCLRPRPAAAHAVVVLAALPVLGSPAAPFDPAVLLLVPLAFAVVRLAWWAEHVPLGGRVELGALRRGLPRAAAVVGVALALGVLALLAAGRPTAGAVALGGVALLAVAWVALRRHDGRTSTS